MEAAPALIRELPARRRARDFERECERLRPLGEAYVMRRFGGSLNRADAEDAVSDVVIRLYRRVAAGDPPQNLRAVFFTSVRNAAIDQLRSRASKPTVALEAASAAPSDVAMPAEQAEGRDDAVRLQEAMQRMRANYREAILLRFGLGMTVPEMSRHLGISLPAAKKLVLRATQQVKKRLASIEGEEFCPEMRDMARRSLVEKKASGLASESESEVLRVHFQHCGSCKSFLSNLQGSLHDLGTAAVLGLGASDHLGPHLGLADRLAHAVGALHEGAQAGAFKVRHAGHRLLSAIPGSDSSAAGALMGTGQKIAAVCTAGAATTATCLLTGAVGPGLHTGAASHAPPPKPAAHVKQAPVVTRQVEEPSPAPEPAATPAQGNESESKSKPQPKSDESSEAATPEPASSSEPTSSESSSPSEFGLQGGSSSSSSSSPSPPPAPAPAAPAPSTSSGSSGGDFGGGGGGSSSGSTSHSGSSGVGFQG
jgi:RNA polymerase sigma factor (sigma-70 family)